jgi:pimeloyl-ACP methyl ester carboxylesterase
MLWLLALLAVVLGTAIAVRQLLVAGIAGSQALSAPNAIDEETVVRIGGIDQWIRIRGTDRRNPVLLFLHGGPGAPMSPLAWSFQRPWEDHFTVVQWDQRGAGRTYALTDPDVVRPTMTMARMVADSEEMTAHLRRRLGQDRIFVMGHSWGSLLAVHLAKRRPEWLHAVVTTGQAVDMLANERAIHRALVAEAGARNDQTALAQLRSVPAYGKVAPTVQEMAKVRVWAQRWGRMWGGRDDFGSGLLALTLLSPDMPLSSLIRAPAAQSFSVDTLYNELMRQSLAPLGTRLDVPIVLLEGRLDLATPPALAEAWLATQNAPAKKLIWFDDSAHFVPLEQPGKALWHLVNDVRPLARPLQTDSLEG